MVLNKLLIFSSDDYTLDDLEYISPNSAVFYWAVASF